jgi:hypothetical protein
MFYTRGAINMALALPASPPFNREVLIDTTAGKDGGGNGDPLGNKEGEDWQLGGQGGGGSNQTKKTKVRAFSLELYATMHFTLAFVVARVPLKLGDVLHKKLFGIGTPVDIISSLLFVLCSLSLKVSCHNLTFIYTFVAVIIFKGGKAKVGKLFPHGNKDDENLQLKGLGGGGSGNQTKKTMVCALLLELFITMPYTAAFAGGFYLITISHLFIIINLLCVPDIMYIKESEAKVDKGQLLLHGNKEDVDLQLDGRSGNQTKKKVRAMFLKLYTTMPWTTAFIVARGVI